MIEDLGLNKEILYDEQVSYIGFAHMETLHVMHPDILNICYGSETGKMLLWPESDLPEGYDPRERPWYIGALYSEEIIWSPPYMDIFVGYLILSGAHQITDLILCVLWYKKRCI
jgi:methyl-accepting chemotaxis protein